jgi:hypothetical protein
MGRVKKNQQKIIDKTFNGCVTILELIAKQTRLNYREVNVLLFCVVFPAVTTWLAYKNHRYKRRYE